MSSQHNKANKQKYKNYKGRNKTDIYSDMIVEIPKFCTEKLECEFARLLDIQAIYKSQLYFYM